MADVISIFKFLKEFNELSNPVITELESQRWSLNIFDLPKIKEIKSVFDDITLDTTILEVRKPILKPCSAPDEIIAEWVEDGWRKLSEENVNIKETITRSRLDTDNQVSYYEERFADNENRQVCLERWIEKRNLWRESELPREQGLNLYNNLFRLYSDMKKEIESVELILGDGIIVWNTEIGRIEHPVLLQKVQLVFNPNVPLFTVKCEEINTELYTPMLRIIPSINQMMLSEMIKEVEENVYHIADFENTKGLFKRIINVIDEKGSYTEKGQIPNEGAIIYSCPVLFLRKRTLGYSEFITNVIDELDKGQEANIPSFFNTMVGKYRETNTSDVLEESWNENGIDQDILLTLPANNEQLRIIKYLNKYGAVLVQGPPGTGKTHTIANLIGHLLSQGNNILVTSQKEKALTVLKDMVYKDPNDPDLNLQSLCISLLSTKSQKQEMDSAINEIAAKGTSLDLQLSRKKITKLEAERAELIEAAKEKGRELLSVRSLEYTDLVFDNHTITPIEAAKFIKQGKDRYDYIEGRTTDDTVGLPVSEDELNYLYNTNAEINEAEERLLDQDLPDLAIWGPDDFNNKLQRCRDLDEIIAEYISKIEFIDSVDGNILNEIKGLFEGILKNIDEMDSFHKLLIEKTIVDSSYSKLWTGLLVEIDEHISKYDSIRKLIFDYEYSIPKELIVQETLETLIEIIESGKDEPFTKLSIIAKPKWKKIKEGIKKQGRCIDKKQDCVNAHEVIAYELKKYELIRKAEKLSSDVDGKIKIESSNFEAKARQFKLQMDFSLSWYEKIWGGITQKAQILVIDRERFDAHIRIELDKPIDSIRGIVDSYLMPEINYQLQKYERRALDSEWQDFISRILPYRGYDPSINNLLLAIQSKDAEKYSEIYSIIENAFNKVVTYKRRKAILESINAIAPDWAKAIKNRVGIHSNNQVPNEIAEAWKLRQLSNQLHRIDSYDQNKLQLELENINRRLITNARYLAYEKAWFEKIKNRTDVQAQAIEGWRTTVRQIGKGTGKNAAGLKQKARELMPFCQSAIPVWIMPLNRVVENFDPIENKFDVVIIDEASQSDILALSALYLGKKIIIVGDDEQVSPDSIGIKKDEVNALIEQFLQGIPNKHLFNGQTSLYDMAKSSGFKPLMLTEHFRCLPEIIAFSNALSYNYRIKPLRDSSNVLTKPAVIEYRVPQAQKDSKKINEIEALHIASLVCACIEQKEYKGKTIGIISLLGMEQSSEIGRLLQTYLDPLEYETRNIQCGTPPQFQGDERDIIFLSVVDSPSENRGPIRLLSADGNNDLTRKRYNVAASRAKDQMWVVHSLNPEIDLKPEDIRLRLIRHAINPELSENEQLLKKAESPFEIEVLKTLVGRGYRVIPQYKVGSYRIDMVIECGNKCIALECDGEKWHDTDRIPEDLKRQAILQRLGWRFIRIRGSVYYRNPESTMEKVYSEFERHDIHPDYSFDNNDENKNKEDNYLIGKVKRRATEIRMEWDGAETDHNDIGTAEVPNTKEVKSIPKEDQLNKNQKTFSPENVQIRESNKNTKKLEVVETSSKDKTKDSKPLFDFRKRNEPLDKTKRENEPINKIDHEAKSINEAFKPRFDFRKGK